MHTLAPPGDARYGLVEPPHHHAICTECAQVTEIPPGPVADALGAAERVSGFALHPAGLTLYGLCPTCQ